MVMYILTGQLKYGEPVINKDSSHDQKVDKQAIWVSLALSTFLSFFTLSIFEQPTGTAVNNGHVKRLAALVTITTTSILAMVSFAQSLYLLIFDGKPNVTLTYVFITLLFGITVLSTLQTVRLFKRLT